MERALPSDAVEGTSEMWMTLSPSEFSIRVSKSDEMLYYRPPTFLQEERDCVGTEPPVTWFFNHRRFDLSTRSANYGEAFPAVKAAVLRLIVQGLEKTVSACSILE